MKKVAKYICVYGIVIILFVLTLITACSFSSEKIYNNVKKSSDILNNEGNRLHKYIFYRNQEMEFDNFTDSLMINTAYSIDSRTPFYSAFVARKNYLPNISQTILKDSAGELKSSSKYGGCHNEVGELNDLVNNDIYESFEYARYWHGYLIVLRPLLLLFNLSQIRFLLTAILFILACIVMYLIAKKINWITSIIFAIGLISIEYFYLGFSLQGVFVFLIAMIFSIYVLITENKIKNKSLPFLIVGMLTNFFDFLTVPLVTLGMPLILYFLLKNKNNKEIDSKENFLEILEFSFLWGIGYGATWITKWILVDCFLQKDLIFTALQQIMYRSSGGNYNPLLVIFFNLSFVYKNILYTMLITVLLTSIYLLLNRKNKLNINTKIKETLKTIFPYIVIAVMPLIWYAFLKNHSIDHAFFTYRNLLLTILCTNISVYKVLETVL